MQASCTLSSANRPHAKSAIAMVIYGRPTRDVIHDIYIRRVEKVDGSLYSVEFETFNEIADPTKVANNWPNVGENPSQERQSGSVRAHVRFSANSDRGKG